jgi:hypothetical protein
MEGMSIHIRIILGSKGGDVSECYELEIIQPWVFKSGRAIIINTTPPVQGTKISINW